MNNTPIEKDRTIHIRDLFFTICQRWRSLFVCILVGAIVLGIYGWWTSGNETITTREQAENVGKSLGEERKGVIEGYASDIHFSTLQIIQQGQYNKESGLMKLDPFHLYVYEVTYYFNTALSEVNSLSRAAVAQAYMAKLQDGFLDKKVTAVIEEEAYSEQKEYYESPQVIQVDHRNLGEGFLRFSFYYPEEQTVHVQELKTFMQTTERQIKSELGEHELILIGESSFTCADVDVLRIQEANAQRINDLTERIENIIKIVTDSEETKYLNYLLSNLNTDSEIIENNAVVKAERHLNKKYIIIGAVLGLILAAVVIIVKYLESNAIKSAKEIEEVLGIQLLGSIEGQNPFNQKRKTKLDLWLRKKRYKTNNKISAEETVDVIATKIKIEAEKANLHHICLAIDKEVCESMPFMESLAVKVGGDPIITVIRNIPEQSEGLVEMADMDGAVLVCQIERSGFDDLKQIRELCRNYSVKVIGSIIVE